VERADAAPHAAPPATPGATVALELFHNKDYATARREFDRAVPAAAPADVATLRFNAAVCSYQLGEFEDAERRFVELAQAAPELAPLALLNAGLAALGRGDSLRARELLERAGGGDAEAEALRAELRQGVADAERAARRRAFEQHFRAGFSAFQRGAWKDSESELDGALAASEGASSSELGTAYYLRSMAALEAGDAAGARRFADAGLRHAPNDAYLHLQRGDLALVARDFARAEQSYTVALAAGLDGAARSEAEDRLEALYPLPARGPFAWAAAGAGFDSNASQSGLTDTLTATDSRERSASAFSSFSGNTGMVWRPRRDLALSPSYGLDVLLLLSEPVRDLSLQAHSLGINAGLALGHGVALHAGGSGHLVLTGLDRVSPMSREAELALGMTLEHSASHESTARTSVRAIDGSSSREYLSGTRLDAALGQRWRWTGWDVWASAGVRRNAIGTQALALRAELSALCGAVCDGVVYRVPLGYWGPWLEARTRHSMLGRVTLEANFKLEYRRYLDESYITRDGAPDFPALNRKTRRDLRYRPGARAEIALDATKHWLISADYTLWVSRSNVAFDPDNAEHVLDYENRSYVQHIMELGFSAQF
jgi:tetratricopeptide (TPR) repeat protein